MNAYAIVVLAVYMAAVSPTKGQSDVPVIGELDVGKYLGRWYQTYASPVVLETFEKDGFCVTATYGLYNDTVLTVYNNQRILAPNGTNDEINGFAFTTDEPGKLLVNFGGGDSGGSNYWIMKLGPVNEYDGTEQYAYSLVSEPSRLSLFILCRDVDEFRNLYEEEALQFCYENGFDSRLNNPVEVYHGDDCIYPGDEDEADF